MRFILTSKILTAAVERGIGQDLCGQMLPSGPEEPSELFQSPHTTENVEDDCD